MKKLPKSSNYNRIPFPSNDSKKPSNTIESYDVINKLAFFNMNIKENNLDVYLNLLKNLGVTSEYNKSKSCLELIW